MARRRPRHHDHRHLPESCRAQGQARRRRGQSRRHSQGRRHDRARHGDHAVLCLHGRADRRACIAVPAFAGRQGLVQRHHGRQRHLDVGHAAGIRHASGCKSWRAPHRERGRPQADRLQGGVLKPAARTQPHGRARRRRGPQVRRRHGRGRRLQRLGQAHRALHRQLAAGQDRHRRRGRQLGPRGDGRRQGGRAGRTRQARHLLRRHPPRHRRRARSGLFGSRHHRIHAGAGPHDPGRHGPRKGRATVWTCDLTKAYVEINGDYRS